MDKQARLSAIMMSINEFNEKLEQSKYGAELALRSREYSFLESCAKKLVAAENEIELLSEEAKRLQEAIEEERLETIL